MKTFIRVAEIWVPSSDGSLLELSSGLYDEAPAFQALSHRMCFGRTEGLPGRAWDEGCPQVLRSLEGSYFRRTAAAREIGLHCAVAWPVFRSGALAFVVVLMGGDPQREGGAFDVLPAGEPDDGTVRASIDDGRMALCLPVGSRDGAAMRLELRSSAAFPLARRVEVWRPLAGGSMAVAQRIARDAAASANAAARVEDCPAAAVGALLTGVAAASRCGAADGLRSLLAMPVGEGAGRRVVVMYW